MKKSMTRKAAALALAAGMLLPNALPVFAAEPAVPTAEDQTTVKVLNVDGAAKVTAYRIYEPVYADEGFVKFTNIGGITLADAENPTAAEITAISQAILNGTVVPAVKIEMTQDGGGYKAELPAGEYVVLVTDQDSAASVYNPMVISAYYTDANLASSLTASADLDATGSFGTVYAKKTSIRLDKTILAADGVKMADNDAPGTQGSEADDLGVGDTGSFKITTQIPAYSDGYKAKGVTYTLTDTQDDGFDAPQNIVVKVGGTTYRAGSDTFTLTVTGNDFTVDFKSAFALEHAGQSVEVTYQAKLNSGAKQKFEANTDKVVLTYTNDLYDKNHVDTLEDDVKEFTFPVQVKKVNEENAPLEGAEFTLIRTDGTGKTGTQEYTIATNEQGIAQFNRLDEGIYTVQETKAPSGYAINPDLFQIQITPEYKADGSLNKYQITMINKTRDNEQVGSVAVSNPDGDILAGNITDSKLQTLPSTGGAGTKMAMVFAAGMAGVTLSLFAYGRKKEREEI